MADTVNFLQNGYSGEVLEDLLTYTVQGNDTVREGLIHIKTGIQHRYTLPAIKLGNIIQDNVPTPQPIHGAKGDDGTNEYQFTERHLEPSDFMVYLEFNPRDYEKYWRFAQPEGNLVFRELDPKIQATMLRLLMDKKNEYIGNAIWTSARGGETVAKITAPEGCTKIGANKEKYFDGVIKRILDNVNSSDARWLPEAVHHFGNDRADGRGRGGGGALCDVEEMSEADPKEDISDLCGRMGRLGRV